MLKVPTDPLVGLRPSHPRLFLTPEEVTRLRELSTSHPPAARSIERVRAACVEMLDAPPVVYDIPDGKRLLTVARCAKDRVRQLVLLARLEPDDPRWSDRLATEAQALADFPDWNPSHFLDTAEAACALGLAYDTLHHRLDLPQRDAWETAIVEHALKPGLRQGDDPDWPYHKFSQMHNNWNVVCHGGLVTAALALADRHPELARRTLREALVVLPVCLQHFEPAGGWPEGPVYWSYLMQYLAAFAGSCRTALGHDFGLDQFEPLTTTGTYLRACIGTTGRWFNYSDSRDRNAEINEGLPFIAATFMQADDLTQVASIQSWSASSLAWLARCPEGMFAAAADVRPASDTPASVYVPGVELVALRTQAPASPAYLAAQAGPNAVGHNRLDLGSFVYERDGVRWAVHLPPDDYNLPHYFGRLRYTYYRNRAEGHNTLVFEPDLQGGQDAEAAGRVVAFCDDPAQPAAALELTQAYASMGLAHVLREFQIDAQTGSVTIEDRLEAAPGAWSPGGGLCTPRHALKSWIVLARYCIRTGKACRLILRRRPTRVGKRCPPPRCPPVRVRQTRIPTTAALT